MLGCRKIQGLIAESLYEELAGHDRKALERHILKCGRCREEAQALGSFVARIPSPPAELDRDLTPAILARVREAARNPRPMLPRFAFAGVAAVVVVLAVSYGVLVSLPGQGPMDVATKTTPSPVEEGLDEVAEFVAARDFPEAYVLLKLLLEVHPEDALAGEAQRIQADIAFRELRWYPEALAGYRSLQQNHGDVYREDAEAWKRLDLLMEARGDDGDFVALHDLDAARQHGAFERLEEVVGRYPGTFVASLAAEDMALTVADSLEGAPEKSPRVHAMESALERCTSPVAIAQLKVEVGHIYRDELHDFDKARTWYEEVAASEHAVLARLAQESLGSLSGTR